MAAVKPSITSARLSNVVEGPARRRFGLSEIGRIRRDDPKTFGEERDQVTEHVAGGWKATK
jgi:hypothetical protein